MRRDMNGLKRERERERREERKGNYDSPVKKGAPTRHEAM